MTKILEFCENYNFNNKKNFKKFILSNFDFLKLIFLIYNFFLIITNSLTFSVSFGKNEKPFMFIA